MKNVNLKSKAHGALKGSAFAIAALGALYASADATLSNVSDASTVGVQAEVQELVFIERKDVASGGLINLGAFDGQNNLTSSAPEFCVYSNEGTVGLEVESAQGLTNTAASPQLVGADTTTFINYLIDLGTASGGSEVWASGAAGWANGSATTSGFSAATDDTSCTLAGGSNLYMTITVNSGVLSGAAIQTYSDTITVTVTPT